MHRLCWWAGFISAGKLGRSLVAVIHAEEHRYSYPSAQTAYFPCVTRGIFSSWPPDSHSPAAPVSAAQGRTSSSLQDHLVSPPGGARCQTLGPGGWNWASRDPSSNLLLKAGPLRVGCSKQEPCPVEFWNNLPSPGPSSSIWPPS